MPSGGGRAHLRLGSLLYTKPACWGNLSSGHQFGTFTDRGWSHLSLKALTLSLLYSSERKANVQPPSLENFEDTQPLETQSLASFSLLIFPLFLHLLISLLSILVAWNLFFLSSPPFWKEHWTRPGLHTHPINDSGKLLPLSGPPFARL